MGTPRPLHQALDPTLLIPLPPRMHRLQRHAAPQRDLDHGRPVQDLQDRPISMLHERLWLHPAPLLQETTTVSGQESDENRTSKIS